MYDSAWGDVAGLKARQKCCRACVKKGNPVPVPRWCEINSRLHQRRLAGTGECGQASLLQPTVQVPA